ncbi:TIGR03564 family F420-dependent LLM class oxidoreductase [Amycolatopsis minnesotensis]|uniref:TIGR03564 family F420-dependent LLM class oxidoreductase n=1 Tax=Amycolatopsis minnesotensis TaxID=337894 RepID=A0ABP5CF43_9PSEU
MRIGINVTPSTDGIEGLTEAARGFDSAWTNQHPGGWDPLTLLTAVEGGPPELGTAIVPTYPRHPVATATEALTVQALTGGRLTLGVGPSHSWYIAEQLGIPYASPAGHTREYLEVLHPLLRGEHVRHSGRFFTVDTRLTAKADPPPVLISALGPRMLEVARDLADGTIAVWVRPELVAEHLVPGLGAGARIVVMVLVAVTGDPDGVRAAVARDFAKVAEMPAYRAVLDRAGLAGPADTVVAGTEAEVVRELRRFRDAGVTDLIVSGLGSPVDRARVRDVVLGGVR